MHVDEYVCECVMIAMCDAEHSHLGTICPTKYTCMHERMSPVICIFATFFLYLHFHRHSHTHSNHHMPLRYKYFRRAELNFSCMVTRVAFSQNEIAIAWWCAPGNADFILDMNLNYFATPDACWIPVTRYARRCAFFVSVTRVYIYIGYMFAGFSRRTAIHSEKRNMCTKCPPAPQRQNERPYHHVQATRSGGARFSWDDVRVMLFLELALWCGILRRCWRCTQSLGTQSSS